MSENKEDTVGKTGGSGLGSTLGVLAFLAGAGALVWVFFAAKGLYALPPEDLVRAGAEATPDITTLAQSATATLLRVMMLVVMAIAAALLAGVGARMFLSSRPHEEPADQCRGGM